MFSNTSLELTRSISKIDKKNQGIFFTPKSIVLQTISSLPFDFEFNTILEPSCGSGEFIDELVKFNKTITGIEYNKEIYYEIKDKFSGVEILNDNFLNHDKKYDLIIGNPPYYVMKKSNIHETYSQYINGRPNIFVLFILHSLHLLNPNGIISFVVPNSFLNCLYYNRVRKLIYDEYTVVDIVSCEGGFIDTKQTTIILTIQNKLGDNDGFTTIFDRYYIFNSKDNTKQIKKLIKGSTTINKLGGVVTVGNIVWNQVKNELTDDNTKTRLIYSGDIINNTLGFVNHTNNEKKKYINRNGFNDDVIIVNRGYGSSKYDFKFCRIDIQGKYLLENHLLNIKGVNNQMIINSFNNKKTIEFINLFFGNNAINATELCYMFPIFNSPSL